MFKNNKKNRLQRLHRTRYSQSGQSIILAMGLFLVASVTLFLVFNSGRAVNEKINLVNAADAAAYSGAQIAARQLNFMAYTNRAMIANEVSIGHVFSYEVEIEVLLRSLLGGLSGPVIDFTERMSGAYMLAVDANNAFYSTLQMEAFRDFAYPSENPPLVEAAMQAVVNDYQIRSTAPIVLNNVDILNDFIANSLDEYTVQAAEQALVMQRDFCRMVMFVKPAGLGASGVTSGQLGTNNEMAAFCDSLATGGGAGLGSPSDPIDDEGAMLEILRTTVASFSNAEWIRDRNKKYDIVDGGILGDIQVDRAGATTVDFDGQLNWMANDSLNARLRVLFVTVARVTVNLSTDAATLSAELGNDITDAMIGLLESQGVCGSDADIDCNTLANSSYKGVQRYTYLNPDHANPRVTAFLAQQKCSDNIGVNDEGEEVAGWHDNLRFLEHKRQICHGEVFAVAQAEVFFQRPECEADATGGCSYGFSNQGYDNNTFTEVPNLYNPFWQVRIVSSQNPG